MDERPSVLVVDDDPIVRESLRQYLDLDECDVGTSANVRDAIDQLARRHWHVMLADVRLPEGS